MPQEEKRFPRGLFASPPRSTAPDFVKCRISIRRADLLGWLSEEQGEWVNLDVKEGFKKDEDGNPKWYCQVDDWKPSKKEEDDDVLPF